MLHFRILRLFFNRARRLRADFHSMELMKKMPENFKRPSEHCEESDSALTNTARSQAPRCITVCGVEHCTILYISKTLEPSISKSSCWKNEKNRRSKISWHRTFNRETRSFFSSLIFISKLISDSTQNNITESLNFPEYEFICKHCFFMKVNNVKSYDKVTLRYCKCAI